MVYSDTDLTKKIDILKNSLDKAEALIIGPGSGLSSAAGLAYDNTDTFNALFPGYHDRYGIKTISEADFYPFPTPEEQYAYWLKSIAAIRYDFLPGKPYLDKLHTTEMGVERIRRNLALTADDVVLWCRGQIEQTGNITRRGKNWYASVSNAVITINAYSYTIITAHKVNEVI
jgi:hypothetical protein